MTTMQDITFFSVPPVLLVIAFLLDLVAGDPRWFPHPVRVIGRGIEMLESLLRRFVREPRQERIGGIILVIVTISTVFFVSYLFTGAIVAGASASSHMIRWTALAIFIVVVSTVIALNGLAGSAKAVIREVAKQDLTEARRKLGMIVGRDTGSLTEKGILMATTETLAENLSDGVIAPLFYLTIGGLPGAMTYKAINTMDSMVGYKNRRCRYFGWAAARLDDAANFIPARITGILIVVASYIYSGAVKTGGYPGSAQRSWRVMIRDGRMHASPNSGIPESAMAGALGIRLGGPSFYGGVMVDKPYIGDEGDADYMDASNRAVGIVKVSSFLALVISFLLIFLVRSYG